jgi:hypothetical protein
LKEPEGGVRQSAAEEKTEETRTAEAKTAKAKKRTAKERTAKEQTAKAETAKEQTICTAAQETKAGLKTAVERAIWEKKLPEPGSRSPRD